MNRKVLASMLVIGAVGVIAAGSTFALFNDTETSDTNTFEAGALDLQIDWVETYNGEVVEEQEFTDNPGSIFDISDVKPGDQGQANVSLHVFDNPAFVNMTMEQTGAAENGCTEPEAEVDDSCADPGEDQGELGEHLHFTIYDNDGNEIFNGTADELDTQSINLGLVDNSTTEYVTIDWWVPRETGNEIQTDSAHFRFDFNAVQARHNGLDDGEPAGEAPITPPDNDTDDFDDINDTDDNDTNITDPDNDTNVTPPDNDTNITDPDNDTNVTPPDNDTNVTPPGNDTDDNDTNGDNGTDMNATATVNFENQTSDGRNVEIDSANLSEGGFIAIHDSSLYDGELVDSVIGASEYLEPGAHEDIEIELFNAPGLYEIQTVDGAQLQENQTLTAMPHMDTNDNETFDYIVTNGSEDDPYTDEEGEPVTDDAYITLENGTNDTNDTNGTPPSNNDTNGDNDTNDTLQGINTVWFCESGTETADSPCPDGERSVATVEWNGTNFEPTQVANDTDVDLNLTARLQDGNLLEVRWFSGNELSSVVSRSNGETCTSSGGTQGVAVVCDPPSTIEIDERRPTLVIQDGEVETVEETGNTAY